MTSPAPYASAPPPTAATDPLVSRLLRIVEERRDPEGKAWSMRSLSRAAGLAANHVEQIKAGRITPGGVSADVLSGIARASGVSLAWLMTGEGPIEAAEESAIFPPRLRSLLSCATFDDADLTGANFEGMNLWGASFQRANLSGANFRGARLDCATFDGANLEGADLTTASADCAKFRGATVAGANFEGTSLQGTDFTGVNLAGVDFTVGAAKGGAR